MEKYDIKEEIVDIIEVENIEESKEVEDENILGGFYE